MLKILTSALFFGTALVVPALAQEASFPYTLISEVEEANTRVTTIAIDFGRDLPLNWTLQSAFSVTAELKPLKSYTGEILANSATARAPRHILRAYTNDKPEAGSPKQGRYVILELDPADFNASSWYVGFNPGFRQILPYEKEMIYDVDLLHDLTYFSPNISQTEAASEVELIPETSDFDQADAVIKTADAFEQDVFEQPENADTRKLGYSFYEPQDTAPNDKHPLVIFLHGSGQSHDTVTFGDDVAADVLSPLLTNQGGVTWVENAPEPAYVLVPQAPDRDFKDQEDEGGWRSADTRSLLLGLIDQLINDHPDIDTDRIYLTGLSMGAMGSWKLLTDDKPEIADRFAAALLMNGRPASSDDIVGDAALENVSVPLWLTHSDTDQSVDVTGSRLPFALLAGGELTEEGIPQGEGITADVSSLVENYRGTNINTGKEIRFTEYNFGDGDHMLELGMVTPIAHFSWEISFKDPEMINWLFSQRKDH